MQNLHLLSYIVVPFKSKVEISQNFVAFSEYMNFNICAHGSQLRNGSRLAPEVGLRARFLVKSHQGHGLEDTPVQPSSMLVFSGQM